MDGDIPSTEVYQLHIALREISPAIWRRVLVRFDSTILDLHYVIQLTMGWTDKHLNCFTIRVGRAKRAESPAKHCLINQ